MSEPVSTESQTPKSEFLRLEDWWAVWIGALLLLLAAVHVVGAVPKPGDWTSNPLEAFPDMSLVWHAVLFLGLAMVTGVAVAVMGGDLARYVKGFALVFLLTLLAQLIGGQATLDRLGLEYALWALLIGLLISNTVGAPDWLMAGARSELFIKAGLVLLGAEVLANRIAELGARGLVVAWLVTPVAIIFMWFFGTRILRITSKSLVMVIACCTSVCGVSAAIASAAACRAKKEELSLAVGMTMIFTVAMMLGMPVLCKLMGLDEYVGGAWIGGTVDSTGAVVVSGEILGETAGKVA
ncbi:MAG: putative sulfate exporter family transporter, partial [Candidatus Hydrogenedentes bacterium]|nr:putative sulfate exporter family transporter [Candidatus Hydrogenedentota bacterium]